jgi:hypothetical protein
MAANNQDPIIILKLKRDPGTVFPTSREKDKIILNNMGDISYSFEFELPWFVMVLMTYIA